jgi:hypothetical protein
MASNPDDSTILAFWAWFASIAERLADDFEDAGLLRELDAKTSALEVVWELGPGPDGDSVLALSPDGDAARLAVTQRIVAMAPTISGWTFLPARRARPNNLEFELVEDDGTRIEIDARGWRYVLVRLRDQSFDIILETNNLGELGEQHRYAAAIVFLDESLGEERRLRLIADVEPVVALAPSHARSASPVAVLAAHLDSLTTS